MSTQSRGRVEGRWVLALLTVMVVTCMAAMLLWAHATPSVPDARQRRRQFALPGVDVDLQDTTPPPLPPKVQPKPAGASKD